MKNEETVKRESELTYRTIFENTGTATVILDADTTILLANSEFEKLTGYSKAQLEGKKSWTEFVVEEDLERMKKHHYARRVDPNTAPRNYEFRLVNRSGEVKDIILTVAMIPESKKSVASLLDVSERKLAEEALREGERFLSNIFTSIQDGLSILDMDMNIIRVNPTMERWYAHAMPLAGKKCYEAYHKRKKMCDPCPSHLTIETGQAAYEVVPKIGTKGEIVGWLDLYSFPLRDVTSGQIKGIIEYVRDITQHKKAVEALEESEERYSSMFEKNSSVMLLVDTETSEIVDANPAACSFYGHSREKMKKMKISDLNMLSSEKVFEKINLAKSSEQKLFYFSHRLANGEIRDVEVYTGPIKIKGRQLLCSIIHDITERKQAQEAIKQSYDKLQKVMEGIIHAITLTVEMRDLYTAGHQKRVALLACAIAREMNLTEDEISSIRISSVIHDIGKIYIPAEILSKPARLAEIEFNMIKLHPQASHDILKTIDFPWPVAQIVLQHHERMDGSGYPKGLTGEDILLEAKILALADVVEAMASHRPYRSSLGINRALKEISKNRGILYDSEVVDACLSLFNKKGFRFDH